ncbi:MAG: Gfo/Idh/MocA family oxidoreductase [Clostridiaceae bacterium]|nr:Gfo/Idh/MocA family oxidoreductase [Clostridiaceae bacterium]
MERKVKIGIIGCGGIGTGKHLPSLAKVPEAEVVAFCDLIPERAEEAEKKFGAEGARVYTDYKELLEKETEIEVIHVCTPNRMHAPITIDALESGRHVMCEKPMAKTYVEARLMLEAAKRTGKKLTIGYQGRQRPEAMYLKKTVERGDLGEIYYAKALALRRRAVPTWGVFLNEFEQGGGPLIDIGTHALDLTLWTMNNYEPAYVVGTKYRKLADDTDQGNAWGNWDPEKFTVEDSAFGFLVMKNGATIVLESSWALNILDPLESACVLCGTKGGADMKDGLRINYIDMGRQCEKKPNFKAGGAAFYDAISDDDASGNEARQWIQAVIHDTDPCVLPEQALCVTQILEGIYTSSVTGKPVYFD